MASKEPAGAAKNRAIIEDAMRLGEWLEELHPKVKSLREHVDGSDPYADGERLSEGLKRAEVLLRTASGLLSELWDVAHRHDP